MNTKIWTVDNFVDIFENHPQINEAARLLAENEVVAFPTETVYGLGGNAESDEAVEKIFKAKGRPSDNPLIIHIAEREQIAEFAEEINQVAKMLMDSFWPGPLTVILKKKEGKLSDKATAGLSTVAVRMPNHPVAQALIKKTGLPIAAPSANSSGKPSPTAANHVKNDLYGRISGIIDGGPTGVGVESTVVDCTEAVPVILRPGGITREQIEAVVGNVGIDPGLLNEQLSPKSPGMKYRHYSPEAPLYLVNGSPAFLQKLVNEKRHEGLRVGILTTEEMDDKYDADVVLACGKRSSLDSVATALYESLRAFNEEKVEIIFSEMFPEEGVGHAIMNRLMKAAGKKVISE